LIKIGDDFYNFYSVVGSRIYPSNVKTMTVEAVNRDLIYYQDIAPSKNFD
jgi:hypothetical protein